MKVEISFGDIRLTLFCMSWVMWSLGSTCPKYCD